MQFQTIAIQGLGGGGNSPLPMVTSGGSKDDGTRYPLKLVITVPFATRFGGAENMLWAFLRHVNRRRIEPVVVFFEHGPFVGEVADLDISTVVREAGRLRDISRFIHVVRQLAADLRRERPDLVVDWMAKTHLYGAAAAALAGMADRVVWWQHVIPSGHWLDRLATLLPARAVGASSYAVALQQGRLRPRRETFVVHPGIEPDTTGVEGEVANLRRALGVSAGASVVGCVGRLEPGRRQHNFLHAVAILRRRGCPVHALVVGGNVLGLSGSYQDRLMRLVRQLGLDDVVTFTGHVADARPYIAALDILMQPGPEAFGIAVLEAMVMGVPVIAVDTGGASEIVEPGVSGLLVAPGDEMQLVEAAERLIADHELRERLRCAGRHRVLSCFGAGRMADEIALRLEAMARE